MEHVNIKFKFRFPMWNNLIQSCSKFEIGLTQTFNVGPNYVSRPFFETQW